MNINELRDQIHQANVKAGWWTNIETGESILETRNRPEMLCLIGSELIEAYIDGVQPDGHLPEYKAYEVELADAAIRIMDLAGGDQIDLTLGNADSKDVCGNPVYDLMEVMSYIVGDALEGYRKGRMEEYRLAVANAFALIQKMARSFEYDFDLKEVIDAKVAYNARRADHKVENRLKSDGKKL